MSNISRSFGRRSDYSDHSFQTLLNYLSEAMLIVGSLWTQLYEAFPGMMKHLPGPHNAIFSHCKAMEAFIGEEVERHRRDLDPNALREYIDTFLIEMKNVSVCVSGGGSGQYRTLPILRQSVPEVEFIFTGWSGAESGRSHKNTTPL